MLVSLRRGAMGADSLAISAEHAQGEATEKGQIGAI